MPRSWLDDLQEGYEAYNKLKPKYDEALETIEKLQANNAALLNFIKRLAPQIDDHIEMLDKLSGNFKEASLRLVADLKEEIPNLIEEIKWPFSEKRLKIPKSPKKLLKNISNLTHLWALLNPMQYKFHFLKKSTHF